MKKLYKNWPVHNLIAHPLSEVIFWLTFCICGDKLSNMVHDATIPEHEKGTGRG